MDFYFKPQIDDFFLYFDCCVRQGKTFFFEKQQINCYCVENF